MRPWEEMLVSPDHPLRDLSKLNSQRLEELLPQGRHIHLAACLDFERAFESALDKQGFFTGALIEALDQSQGPISYLQLQRYVRHQLRMGNFNRPQTPQIYTPRGFEKDLSTSFLFGNQIDQLKYGNVSYNLYEDYWSMDLGGIHGIVLGEGEDRMGVNVQIDQDNLEQAYITEVAVDHSKLVFACEEEGAMGNDPISIPKGKDEKNKIDIKKRFKGYISGLMTPSLKNFLGGK